MLWWGAHLPAPVRVCCRASSAHSCIACVFVCVCWHLMLRTSAVGSLACHAALCVCPCVCCRRNFYIEVPELARMSAGEVEEYRKQLDGIKVRGKDVPKPVKNWNQVRAAAVCMCGCGCVLGGWIDGRHIQGAGRAGQGQGQGQGSGREGRTGWQTNRVEG